MNEQNVTSRPRPCALPDRWVVEIFRRLELTFGSKFSNLWRNVDPAEMRAHWAEKLGGFIDKPDALKQALEACESMGEPPTLPAFINACREAAKRQPHPEALPAPELSVEERMERAKQLDAAVSKASGYDYKGWAKELRRRYLAGEAMLPIQISMASEALGETWNNRECFAKVAA